MHRAHADVVHGRDAETHGDRPEAYAQVGRLLRVSGVDADADHDHAQQERGQGGENQVVDGARKARRKQANEMHRPHTRGQRKRRPREGQSAPKSGGAVQLGRKG